MSMFERLLSSPLITSPPLRESSGLPGRQVDVFGDESPAAIGTA